MIPPAWSLRLLEANLLPDPAIRAGIRRIVRQRRDAIRPVSEAARVARVRRFGVERSQGPIAVDTAAANAQHYEVPTAFYQAVLGRHMKYSSGWWNPGTATLDEAEARMLAMTGERAALADGQRVLELGCGWGSLSLWIARTFPESSVVAVSNSATQKAWIDQQTQRDGLSNLEVITADMNTFDAPGRFDRVVSVEMFEHMRNWRALLSNVSRWLHDDGRMFLHIFTHRTSPYLYEVRDASDWMAEHFFTGGIMPSDDLIYEFGDLFAVAHHWKVPGTHYQRTAEAWLTNMDAHRKTLRPLFEQTYGEAEATRWWVRWRVFFMACAELWGFDGGQEWLVSHYQLEKASR